MSHMRLGRVVACAAVVCGVLTLPVTGASASDASIKRAIKIYNPKILVAEGHLVTAIGEYKASGNPAPVITDLDASIGVLHSLKTKIAAQAAASTRVKEGKTKLLKGLHAVIVAYDQLKVAFGERAGSPTAAKENAEKAEVAVKKGRKDLAEAVLLLK
jgi:hypothetical protein